MYVTRASMQAQECGRNNANSELNGPFSEVEKTGREEQVSTGAAQGQERYMLVSPERLNKWPNVIWLVES